MIFSTLSKVSNGALMLSALVASLWMVGPARAEDETADQEMIRGLLSEQVACWNRGDIDGFMETYWKSEELTFSAGGTTTRGWQATIDRYKRRYNTPEAMGELEFGDLEVTILSPDAAMVLGNWELKRENDRPHGNFSLVLRKFASGWKIVHDHSSSAEED